MARRRGIGLLLGLGACGAPAPAPEALPGPETGLREPARRGEVPEEARVADYFIDARLDEEEHRIDATVRITWRNPTSRTVTQMPLHLYMNAFRAEDTVWMREARGRHRGQARDASAWGYIDVSAARLLPAAAGGVSDVEAKPAAPVELSFREDPDPTTMTLDLPAPVGPAQTVTLELEFTTQLPRVFARTGYADDFHFVGQWFPKLGVLEEGAGWQAHTFTLFSEFYADFGHYEVHLDVPEDVVVGASGILTEEVRADGRKKQVWRAEMVHDFAWTASSHFVEHFGDHEGIRIRQLLQPEHAADAPAHLEAQKWALASFERHYGPYPWSTITIVHVPDGAAAAGGMEYPTLYTTSDILLPGWVPPWLLEERVSGLFTTVHEFGHQYFQGLFASNEFAQPWLDEGMNTTADIIAYHDAFGEEPWIMRLAGHPLSTGDMVRLSLMRGGLLDPIDQSSGTFADDAGTYGAMVYQKTAAVMMTLRALVGVEAWDRAIAAYAAEARFRHPTGARLEEVLVRELGERVAVAGDGGPGTVWLDVQDYLDQGLREVSECDFSIHRLRNDRRVGAVGWHRDEHGQLLETEAPDDFDSPVEKLPDEQVEGKLVVHRAGGMRVPLEIDVELADGARERVVWDGQARHHTFRWPGRRIRMAVLDPERRLWVESRRLDNVAHAPGAVEPGGLPEVLGDWAEASHLAVLGGIGP
jgi:hypothetical protein